MTLEPTGEKTEKSSALQNTLTSHKIDGLLVSKNAAFVNTGEMPYEIGGRYPYPQSNALVHNGELYGFTKKAYTL